jgi:hypothetical protein
MIEASCREVQNEGIYAKSVDEIGTFCCLLWQVNICFVVKGRIVWLVCTRKSGDFWVVEKLFLPLHQQQTFSPC